MTSLKSLEPIHLKFILKFDILTEAGNYLGGVLAHFQKFLSTISLVTVPIIQHGKMQKFADFWALVEGPVAQASGPAVTEQELHKIISKIRNLQEHYYDVATPLLSNYYSSLLENAKTEEYYRFLTSENLIDQMERLRKGLHDLSGKISKFPDFKKFLQRCGNVNIVEFFTWLHPECAVGGSPFEAFAAGAQHATNNLLKMSFDETINRFMFMYEDNKLELPPPAHNTSDCPLCKKPLVLFADDSEMRCELCGFVDILCGTLFDDNQFYNQQIPCAKHKKHNPNLHCAKWLYQIQAKEVKNILPKAIEILNQRAVKEYTRGGIKRSMHELKCRQIRSWLKELKLAKLNNHAPLLRKIITGLNGESISPPLLTNEEEQRILNDFSLAIEIFEVYSKKEEVLRLFNKPIIRNKLYYPFFLLKILVKHLKGDPRLKGLIECIHLQSSVTLTKDDYLWKMICQEMTKKGKKYIYEPTARTMLVDII